MRGWTTFEQVKDQELLELLCQSSLSRVSVESQSSDSWSARPCPAYPSIPLRGCQSFADGLQGGTGHRPVGSGQSEETTALSNTVKHCKTVQFQSGDISQLYHNYRRKFRSQTSDNMDRWKSRGGKSQRGEEQKREDKRRERVRRKKMQVREKVGKSRNIVFFQWYLWLRRIEK